MRALATANGYAAFAHAAIAVLYGARHAQAVRARVFAQGFSWERFGREILDALESAR